MHSIAGGAEVDKESSARKYRHTYRDRNNSCNPGHNHTFHMRSINWFSTNMNTHMKIKIHLNALEDCSFNVM